MTAIQQVFAQGADFYCPAVKDPDPRVRAEAARALELLRLPDHVALLLAQLDREHDAKACQAILTCLGELRAQSAIPLIRRFLASPDQLTKLRAAGALCQIAPPLPDDAFQILVDFAMADISPDRPKSKEQAEAESNLAVDAIILIKKLGEEASCQAAERWISAMDKQLDSNHLVTYVHRLLAWTVRQVHERASPLEFSRLERRVLQAVAACSRYWRIGTYLERQSVGDPVHDISVPQVRSHLFTTLYGLPNTQEGLRELVAKLEVP